ncbi:MAG: sterol desaturase family protein [Pseudomonadota bacterium]
MSGEIALRLGVFFGVFLTMALLERQMPMRRLVVPRLGRWATNWSVSVIDSVMVKLIFGAAAAGAAMDAAATGTGLFNMLGWPSWLAGILCFVLLDFAIWLQHLASHKIPVLWRLHRVHHSDRDFDVTTAIRFHPIEIAFSMVLKIGLVYALGAPLWSVILFEIVLNGAAMFNHANLRLPRRLDAALRLAVVTPDMHRVHHSIDRREHDANYGFNFSVWDRLFGTYVDQPAGGHEGMTIGLPEHQDRGPTGLVWTLAFPFRR